MTTNAIPLAQRNALEPDSDLSNNAVSEIATALLQLLADAFCAIRKDQELPLASEWQSLSRLPPPPRRTRGSDFFDHR